MELKHKCSLCHAEVIVVYHDGTTRWAREHDKKHGNVRCPQCYDPGLRMRKLLAEVKRLRKVVEMAKQVMKISCYRGPDNTGKENNKCIKACNKKARMLCSAIEESTR